MADAAWSYAALLKQVREQILPAVAALKYFCFPPPQTFGGYSLAILSRQLEDELSPDPPFGTRGWLDPAIDFVGVSEPSAETLLGQPWGSGLKS